MKLGVSVGRSIDVVDASFFFVNDFGPQLAIMDVTVAITDPSEAMTYPVCDIVPQSTMADPHTTVLQFTTLNYIKIRIIGGQSVNMSGVAFLSVCIYHTIPLYFVVRNN